MASSGKGAAADIGARLILLALAITLAICAAIGWHWRASPRGVTVAALAGLATMAAIWRRSGRLRTPILIDPPAPPLANAGLADPRGVRLLEARQEHAPVALFKIENGLASPINARARRIVAPGHATDREALYRQLIRDGQTSRRLISYESERGPERALVSRASIIVDRHLESLIAVMPVESDLEAETLRAWQKLVHVLTHEIMNSLTPVASLSQTMRSMIEDAAPQLPKPLHDDLMVALSAISRRADSLVHFVSSYRSLSTVPEARAERVSIQRMFERLEMLIAPTWALERGGTARFSVQPASLELIADEGQIEQSLLNLTRNAYEATSGQAVANLEVTAGLGRGGRLRLEVADDGPGVPDADVGHIFTPFFSTKDKGRGIGLALVRQLVHNNGGSVRYARRVQGGARFIVTF